MQGFEQTIQRFVKWTTDLGAALVLVAILAGCGGGGESTRLVAPPGGTAATVAVIAAPSVTVPSALPLPSAPPTTPPTTPPAPTTTLRPAPTVAIVPSPTRTAPPPTAVPTAVPTAIPIRPPTAIATRPLAPTPTNPPPPGTRAPASAAPGAKARAVDRGPATRRTVALTFDAGADRGYAGRILDTLRDSGVKATFGMTGKWAEQNPDLVQRMVAEGHQLMNHTYDHASFTGYSPGTAPLSADERRREIERTEAVIGAIVGVELKPYFRPPYGDYDEAMLSQLGQLGYTRSVMWTVDSLGWNGRSAEQIVKRCVDGTVPGAILLFHVGAASQDAAALPELLRQLQAAGYGFATIAELLR